MRNEPESIEDVDGTRDIWNARLLCCGDIRSEALIRVDNVGYQQCHYR